MLSYIYIKKRKKTAAKLGKKSVFKATQKDHSVTVSHFCASFVSNIRFRFFLILERIFVKCIGDSGHAVRPLIELTQFPRIGIFHGQYNEPRSGEDELRSSQLDRGLK